LQITQFEFHGLEEFGTIQKRLFDYIYTAFEYTNYEFQQAVEEAVCNAARYSVDGPTKAKISIHVRKMAYDIAVTVRSKTEIFDAEAYKKKLLKLLEDPKIAEMDWGDYIAGSTASSGFWYMLTGCDYLYIDSEGQSVTLVAKTGGEDYLPNRERTTRIDRLVPRFMIRKNGVIV